MITELQLYASPPDLLCRVNVCSGDFCLPASNRQTQGAAMQCTEGMQRIWSFCFIFTTRYAVQILIVFHPVDDLMTHKLVFRLALNQPRSCLAEILSVHLNVIKVMHIEIGVLRHT